MNNSKKLDGSKNSKKKRKTEAGMTKKARTRLILIGVACVVVFAAIVCVEQFRPKVILNIGGEKYYKKDMMYEIYVKEQQYDNMNALYQQMYGKDYWDMQVSDGGKSGREEAKEKIIQAVTKREVLYQEAKKKGITLTDAEKKEIESSAKKSREKMNDYQRGLDGLDEESFKTALEKDKLGEKYKEEKLASYKVDEDKVRSGVSKEDNKQFDLQYYYVDTQKTNSENKTEELPKAEQDKLKKQMEGVLERAKKGGDFTKLKKDSDTGVKYDTRKMLASGVDFLTEADRKKIKSMKVGEITDLIKVTTGYYIVKLVDNTSTEGYEKAVQEAFDDNRDAQFTAEYKKLLADSYDVKVGTSNWDEINVGNVTI